MLSANSSFPNFSLKDQDGVTHTNSDFKGKWIIAYVYPKDDTPGCTIQAKAFNASKQKFDELNTVILGLSADDVQSHKNFCNKFDFKFTLLADPQAQLLKALGIGQSEYKGATYWDRTTFLVDPTGKIRKIYENVNPQGHEMTLAEDIKVMQR